MAPISFSKAFREVDVLPTWAGAKALAPATAAATRIDFIMVGWVALYSVA